MFWRLHKTAEAHRPAYETSHNSARHTFEECWQYQLSIEDSGYYPLFGNILGMLRVDFEFRFQKPGKSVVLKSPMVTRKGERRDVPSLGEYFSRL
jgi:hypothetical protein